MFFDAFNDVIDLLMAVSRQVGKVYVIKLVIGIGSDGVVVLFDDI